MLSSFVLVLKSDNANGLFGLKTISPIVVRESTNVTVAIERSKGQFGSVTVSWSVFKVSTSVLASDDFILASGSVDFAANENEKVCTCRHVSKGTCTYRVFLFK